MDFVGGNLDEYLHPERHLEAVQQGALGAPPQPQEEPQVPPQVCRVGHSQSVCRRRGAYNLARVQSDLPISWGTNYPQHHLPLPSPACTTGALQPQHEVWAAARHGSLLPPHGRLPPAVGEAPNPALPPLAALKLCCWGWCCLLL